MATIMCSRCGGANEGNVRFCGHCGADLQATPAQAAALVACPRCGKAASATVQFCGYCGQALHAMAAAPAPYAVATQAQVALAAPHKTGRRIPWALLSAVLGVSMVGLALAARGLQPQPVPPCDVKCQPQPPRPPQPPLQPNGPPLPPPKKYTSSAFGFSFEYPPMLPDPVALTNQSVGWSATNNTDGSQLLLSYQGASANGSSAQQIVTAYQQSTFPNATVVYTIPGAGLGYVPGYGNIYDMSVSSQSGQQQEYRLAVEATIQNGVAVQEVVESELTPDKNSHAMPAQIDPFMQDIGDTIGNSVTWQGEQQL